MRCQSKWAAPSQKTGHHIKGAARGAEKCAPTTTHVCLRQLKSTAPEVARTVETSATAGVRTLECRTWLCASSAGAGTVTFMNL